jgi:NADH-ubiquinone oxidoreductase chain 3
MITFFFIFIPILAIILLLLNVFFAPHNPYQEKNSPFECGYHSFIDQNRTQFNIAFYIFGLCFLIFDLEILLLFPYSVSGYLNDIYGLIIALFFVFFLTIGLAYELGKGVLNIKSRQSFYSLINYFIEDNFNFNKRNKIIIPVLAYPFPIISLSYPFRAQINIEKDSFYLPLKLHVIKDEYNPFYSSLRLYILLNNDLSEEDNN